MARSHARTVKRGLACALASIATLAFAISFTGCNRRARAPGPDPVTLTVTLAGIPRGPGAGLQSQGDKIRSLDPARADDPASADQTALVYETLYAFHYLKRPYVLIPRLAEAMPTTTKNGDGQTVTIAIRKGVLFEDDRCFVDSGGRGRELTADDVVYTLRRLADPRTGAERAWSQLEGWIDGLSEWRESLIRTGEAPGGATASGSGGSASAGSGSPGGLGEATPIAGLRVLDRYRLEIRLTSAALVPALPGLLAHTFTAIVPHEAVDAYGGELGAHPVGTGPFLLAKMNAAARLIWQRNPTFRHESYPSEGEPSDRAAGLLADAGRELPLFDRLVVVADDDPARAWTSLLSGEVDLAPSPDPAPSSLPPGLEYRKFSRDEAAYLSFNMKDPFLARTRAVRVAIRLALGSGALPAQQNSSPLPRPNSLQAKQVLALAGYPGGMELPIIDLGFDAGNPADRDAVLAMRASLEAAGIRIRLRELRGAELEAELKAAKIPLWGGAWNGNPAVSEQALNLPTDPSAPPTTASDGERELDRLLSALGPDSVSVADRLRIAKFLADDRFIILGFRRDVSFAVRPRLHDFKLHELGTGMARYYRADP